MSHNSWRLQAAALQTHSAGTYAGPLLGGGNKTSQPAKQASQSSESSARVLRLRPTSLNQQGSDLTGADVSAALLSGMDFRGSRFEYANLAGAKFVNSNLLNTSFFGWEYPMAHSKILCAKDHLRLLDFEVWLSPVTFSPDLAYIAGSTGLTVKFITISTRTVQNLHEHKGSVGSVCFSSDGTLLLSASWDRTIRVWAVPSRSITFILSADYGVFSAAFVAGTSDILCTLANEQIQLWNTREKFKSLAPATGRRFAASRSWSRLATGTDAVEVWEFPSMKRLGSLPPGNSPVKTMCFSPTEEYLAVADQLGNMRVFELARAAVVHTGYVDGLEAIHCEDDFVILRLRHSFEFTSFDALIRGRPKPRPELHVIGQKKDGSVVGIFQHHNRVYLQSLHTGAVTTLDSTNSGLLTLSPDCKFVSILNISDRCRLTVVAVDTSKKFELQGDWKLIQSVCLVPEQPFLIVNFPFQTQLWNIEKNELLVDEELDGVARPIGVLASGKFLFAEALIRCSPDSWVLGPIMREVVLAPNGQWLAWIGQYKSVHLQHFEQGHIADFPFLKKPSITFSENSSRLIICGGVITRVIRLKAYDPLY